MNYHLLITDEAAEQLLSEAKWYLERAQSEAVAKD